MKQLIYYIKLTDGTELISITRADAIEKINNHYKKENYYQKIKVSTLDRLILNRQSNSYIEIANKTPINEYYKTQVDLFILNDKKQRTDDAMKKAINRYVNKLYYSNHIVENDVKTKPLLLLENEYPSIETESQFQLNEVVDTPKTVLVNNDIPLIETESQSEIITDDVKTNDAIDTPKTVLVENDISLIETESQSKIITDDIKTNEIIKDDIKPLDLSNCDIKTINIVESEIEQTNIDKTEAEVETDILNNDTIDVVKREIEPIDVVETEEETNNYILKQLTDYLNGNVNDDARIGVDEIQNYYDNNKQEVEMLFANNNMSLLLDDAPKTVKKLKRSKRIKQKLKTLRNRQIRNHRKTIKYRL